MPLSRLSDDPGPWTTTREDADPGLLPPEELAARLAGSPWRSLVVIGDSLAEGIGEPLDGYRPRSWADRLADALSAGRPGFRYLNTGRMHARTGEVIATQLPRAVDFGADLAVVVCGGNDLWSSGYDRSALSRGLDHLVGTLRDAGSDVVVFTLMDVTRSTALPDDPTGLVTARLRELADVTREVAAEHGAVLVDLADDPASADPDMYASDAVHSSARGHAHVATVTLLALERFSARQAAGGGAGRAPSGSGRRP